MCRICIDHQQQQQQQPGPGPGPGSTTSSGGSSSGSQAQAQPQAAAAARLRPTVRLPLFPMGPLTSPHDCSSCLQKSQKIAELERRISNLYCIRDGEDLIDSVIAMGPGPPGNPADMDSTVPELSPPVSSMTAADLMTPAIDPSPAPPVPEPSAPHVGSVIAADSSPVAPPPAEQSVSLPEPRNALPPSTPLLHQDPWLTFGARPKWATKSAEPVFTSSPKCARANNSSPKLWSTVHGKKHRSGPISLPPSVIKSNNKYDILSVEDFPPPQSTPDCPVPHPPLVVGSAPRPPSTTSASRRRIVREAALAARRSGDFPRWEKNKPPSVTVDLPDTPPTPPTLPAEQRGAPPPRPRPLFPPTTAIVGDSIIKYIHFFNSTTHCYPGATVAKITDLLPDLIKTLPPSVDRLVVHVGTNDVVRGQFGPLRNAFIKLLTALKDCGKSVFISGPLPTHELGAERLGRLRQLHSWLQAACTYYDFNFIDNFNSFQNRPSFYRLDGLHPSKLGTGVLAANFQYAVRTTSQQAHA